MPLNSPNDITILLLEDDDIDAMSMKRVFKSQKITNTIVRAKDGLEAFELLESQNITKPFIILLDLQMPRMNGLEFLTKLRNTARLKDSVVFVLTTSQHEKDIFESYQLNVAGYFVKDNLKDLVNVLNDYWKVVHLPGTG